MARDVFILGGWQTDFATKAPNGDLFPLLESATLGALDDARIAAADVDVIHVGNCAGEIFNGQAQIAAMVCAIDPGLDAKPASRHEAACASGSIAVLAATAEIEAGRYEVALVAGVEVLRNRRGVEAGQLLGCATWVGRESVGEKYPWPSQFARIAEEYDARYGLQHQHLGRIAEINRSNAHRNPLAQGRTWDLAERNFYDDDEYNRPVSGILRMQDCARTTDGAAAIILAGEDYARRWAEMRGVALESVPRILGWGQRTADLLLEARIESGRNEKYVMPHLRRTIEDAYRRAGISGPGELDAIETHDCMSFTEYLAIDHFGITEPGCSWQAVEDGVIEFGGALPINPSGGLLSGGHPVGATGVRMLLDSAKQVRGEAGDYQVEDARTVATLNIGGACTTVASFVVGSDRP